MRNLVPFLLIVLCSLSSRKTPLRHSFLRKTRLASSIQNGVWPKLERSAGAVDVSDIRDGIPDRS
jgi:hypothetical protein